MSYTLSSITHATTGVKTMTVGYQPVRAVLTVRPSPAGSSPIRKASNGVTDGTNQICDSDTVETTRIYQRRFTDRMASIWEYTGGAWTEVFKITFDSFTATEFKYNVVIANSAFQVMRETWG